MDNPTLRILDAAANRAREALRVLEDSARFAWDDAPLTEQLKSLRHDLAAALALLPMPQALAARDTPGDVGTTIKTEAEFSRTGLADILTANSKRLTEALRSLEEFAKTLSNDAAQRFEKLRYRAYAIEQQLATRLAQSDAVARFTRVKLYVLLTEALCVKPWQDVLTEILAAGGDALCVQLREKTLPDHELLQRAKFLAEKCKHAGVLSIINDRADIALLSNADGIHLGQTDMPLPEVRRLLPSSAIVGISTENLPQARQALADGASYVAVGPMFPTTTKDKPRIAGPAYAAEAIREIPRPLVAIGGITVENLPILLATGVTRVAVSSAILNSPEPGKMVSRFLALIPSSIPR